MRLTYDKVTWRPWESAMKLIDSDQDVRMALILSKRRVGFRHLVQYLADGNSTDGEDFVNKVSYDLYIEY